MNLKLFAVRRSPDSRSFLKTAAVAVPALRLMAGYDCGLDFKV
jgi:hypothetical protein